ncbi:MAG TPA: phosphatidate cytidylyltransferase [Candidatus Scubalenecus merdavium]|uniref:Phosphatidate cytidylyltransferase n=1 Tax=Candidatus Scybalenecus merdavium TaxID=2840939 RepID=A0A9D1SNG9_9FIRM|nr:phosphatidate cytidylyltransferase [Candidatus Scubalenecus merdavium]
MKQRVITGLVLAAVLVVVVWQIYTPALVVVVAFLSAVAANEIMRCAKIVNKFILIVGTAFAAVVPFFSNGACLEPFVSEAVWSRVIGFVPHVVYVTALVIVFFLAMLRQYNKTKFEDVTTAVFASVVVPYGFSIIVRLRDIGGADKQIGIYFIFYALISALVNDIGAQLTGMVCGKHKMSPNISPKKTVEGAVGGLVLSLVANVCAILLYNHFADAPLEQPLMIALICLSPVVALLGMFGDLTASVLKRNFGVKDFGKIFPGHGGVMDRFDSSLFTLAVVHIIALAYFSAAV